MQRSFSIVDDDFEDEELKVEELLNKPKTNNELYSENIANGSDSEENSNSPKKSNLNARSYPDSSSPVTKPSGSTEILLPGSSRIKSPQIEKLAHLSSDSDDSEHDDKIGEYDPKEFEDLEVDPEAKEIFQYITKYIPQKLNLDYKFKPFIPEFLPSVGDIDAFLKVIPPELNINREPFNPDQFKLGLEVLDEPAANQSDPALLHLQLRASSVKANDRNTNMVVKKVADIEKNVKTIDKWMKDISDLHKSKSPPIVRYSDPMPDLDDLMQEWSEEKELLFQKDGFPEPDPKANLNEYITTVCEYFNIPVSKNKIQSLHLFFSLFAAIKTSLLYQANKSDVKPKPEKNQEADQLVLD